MPIPELHTAPALSRLCGIFLLFDEIYTEIFPKYYREGNEKVNIFCFLLKLPLEHTGALISIQEHSGALQSAQESLMRTHEY